MTSETAFSMELRVMMSRGFKSFAIARTSTFADSADESAFSRSGDASCELAQIVEGPIPFFFLNPDLPVILFARGGHGVLRILHPDARDLHRLQVELAGAVPAQARVGGRDGGRHEGRQSLLPLAQALRAEPEIDPAELGGVRLSQGNRVPPGRFRGAGSARAARG